MFLFENEKDVRCLLWGYRDLLPLDAQIFLPGLDSVVPWRQVAEIEFAIRAGDGVVGIIDHRDPRVHPRMYVALDPNHDLRRGKVANERRRTRILTLVPFAIQMGPRMNIVRHRIGIVHLQGLPGLYTEHAWREPAALLVDGNRLRWR